MKLLERIGGLSPKNYDGGWNFTNPGSWWGMVGSVGSVSGKFVSEDSALTFAPVCAATRCISETLASLPLNLLEQVNERTTNKAVKHPLWRIFQHLPNPEQDIVCFIDMQVALQLNWGNAYAEIQRDMAGRIVALWPIHPSRIPLQNITRNSSEPYAFPPLEVGQPGEIVYWVRNDDYSVTPIPASDMLHVPGILSRNGITGQSIPRLMANSFGIGIATEEHAGALFRNGAVTNMAIKTAKIVGKEVAERLREQWQRTFAGASNHYKTLILEDGMEPVPMSMNAEGAELIASRKFSISDVARAYRVPPHMIGDLERSTNNNIEQQSLEFIIYCLKPWLSRWEEALYRQLLSRQEQDRLFFEFDLGEMLRGDSAGRAAWFQAKFNMGAASPNDIRAADHENPVEGGDTYFVQSNNYMPLDKVGEMADAQIEKMKAPPPAPQKPSEPPPATDFSPIFDRISTTDANLLKLSEAVATFSAVQSETFGLIADSMSSTVEVPDTKAAEEIAVREAKVAEKQSEIDEKARKEREITDSVLILSLKKSIDSLATWEAKAIIKARDKPIELSEWRAKFYPRFIKQFVSELSEYVPEAERCEIVLDLQWAAEKYADQSILDMKSLDQHAKDNFFDRVKECTDHFIKRQWVERSKVLAAELVERGRKTFCEMERSDER